MHLFSNSSSLMRGLLAKASLYHAIAILPVDEDVETQKMRVRVSLLMASIHEAVNLLEPALTLAWQLNEALQIATVWGAWSYVELKDGTK